VKECEDENQEKKPNKTPSWSWASMDGPLFLDCYKRYESLADREAYTLSLAEGSNPAGQVVSASLKIKAYSAEVEWAQNGPVILGEPKWGNDIYHLECNIDDPDDSPSDGARYRLAALVEDDWLGKWEGLMLQASEIGGELVHSRIGHFLLYESQVWERRPCWRDDYKTMFGEEKKAITLI